MRIVTSRRAPCSDGGLFNVYLGDTLALHVNLLCARESVVRVVTTRKMALIELDALLREAKHLTKGGAPTDHESEEKPNA